MQTEDHDTFWRNFYQSFAKNSEGMTWEEWRNAATCWGPNPFPFSEERMRKWWADGVDPTDIAAEATSSEDTTEEILSDEEHESLLALALHSVE